MKKVIIFFATVVLVVCGISYIYLNYKANYNDRKKSNLKFETYLDREITGAELATVINRAIDSNIQNSVDRNKKGIYLDNNTNSINIEIKFSDIDTTYNAEIIEANGIQSFIENYSNINFKCIDVKYHESTKLVKYMLFEQITS